jgi:hypothetical protein
MPTLLTYTELRILGDRPDARAFFQKAPDLQGKNVFLSHTTKDDDLVPGVVLVLENHGGRVYVDHQDQSVEGADLGYRLQFRQCRFVEQRCTGFGSGAEPSPNIYAK